MGVPLIQAARVGSYIMKQKLRRRKKYPLVLMLEPLFACNLECSGCGKIQYPDEVLRQRLRPEECWAALDEFNRTSMRRMYEPGTFLTVIALRKNRTLCTSGSGGT